MKKLHFDVNIDAPINKVYDVMLGISKKSTYEQWTAMFNPTSTYEGDWNKGSKMLFVGTDSKGEKGGMISEVFDVQPNRFVSVRHYGLLKGETEITEGPEVENWDNAFENYTFEEKNGTTNVAIDIDTAEDFSDYLNETYPKALDRLKSICEQN